jgi:hypothetical protein
LPYQEAVPTWTLVLLVVGLEALIVAFDASLTDLDLTGLGEPDFGDTASRLEAAEAMPHTSSAEIAEAKNLFILTSFHDRNTCQN